MAEKRGKPGNITNQVPDYTVEHPPWVEDSEVVSSVTDSINFRSDTHRWTPEHGRKRSGGIAAFVHDKPGSSGRR